MWQEELIDLSMLYNFNSEKILKADDIDANYIKKVTDKKNNNILRYNKLDKKAKLSS